MYCLSACYRVVSVKILVRMMNESCPRSGVKIIDRKSVV